MASFERHWSHSAQKAVRFVRTSLEDRGSCGLKSSCYQSLNSFRMLAVNVFQIFHLVETQHVTGTFKRITCLAVKVCAAPRIQ